MNTFASNHNYEARYKGYFGGVSALTPAHYELINGFSNSFFGWGGEDDDFFSRIQRVKLGHESLDKYLGR